jgi:hypothetical protein
MPKAGRRRKKTRTHVAEDENAQSALSSAEALKVPKSLVVRFAVAFSPRRTHSFKKIIVTFHHLHSLFFDVAVGFFHDRFAAARWSRKCLNW